MTKLPLTSEAFREVASRYATGVVIVTTSADGFDHAMTATSFTTVSLDPMRVLICVECDTRFHDALVPPDTDGVGASWGISVIPQAQEAMASWFSTKGRPLHGQFERFDHFRGDVTNVILFDCSIATMELVTTETHLVGDHTIVIGEVKSLSVTESFGEDDQLGPLTYWARRYRNLTLDQA